MKKIFITTFLYFSFFVNKVFGTKSPHLDSYGLPGKESSDAKDVIRKIIEEFIQIVFAVAVFALIIAGVYFLISAGNEEKIKKAREWIIWSLVGVLLASLSWGIVGWLNNVQVNT